MGCQLGRAKHWGSQTGQVGPDPDVVETKHVDLEVYFSFTWSLQKMPSELKFVPPKNRCLFGTSHQCPFCIIPISCCSAATGVRTQTLEVMCDSLKPLPEQRSLRRWIGAGCSGSSSLKRPSQQRPTPLSKSCALSFFSGVVRQVVANTQYGLGPTIHCG